ncbi:hypothetical protein [Microbacterium radiodurans]|uniref:Lipoprotein n=1 Tax=Microbacterium radiodurans TaxID=661398 RepID=A0A5J5IUH4_9MICO|nr:hypothetical protein [Microbacterium radiodurans]KAA9089259.1 hypothetical protein F6B42_01865 [Microbacterium radiodurans]
MMRKSRRWGAPACVIMAVLILTACTAGSAAQATDLYEQAREVNRTFKETVAEVQRHIFDGEWRVRNYGDMPDPCDDGYEYYLTRATPEEFTFDEQGPQRMQELEGWLVENGWVVAPSPTYGEGIDNIIIMAGKPDAFVSRLDIDLLPGVAAEGTVDVLAIRATSTCQPGDANELIIELYPGFPVTPADQSHIPERESPDTPRWFGLTEDGQPRPL